MTTEAKKVRAKALKEAAKQVPTTWLDDMLTGPNAVVGRPPYGCPDIERVCQAIKKRIEGLSQPVSSGADSE